MINVVYGKTMENDQKKKDIKLCHKWNGRYSAEALIARPDFHSDTIFDENLVAVQLFRTEVDIKKPIYVGLCVLKTIMLGSIIHLCVKNWEINAKSIFTMSSKKILKNLILGIIPVVTTMVFQELTKKRNQLF